MKSSLKVLDSRNFLTLHKKKVSLWFACGKFSSKSYIMFVLGTSFFPYVLYSKLIFYTFPRCFLFRFSIFPSTALLVISIASMCTVFRTSSFLLPQLFRLALFFYYSNSLFFCKRALLSLCLQTLSSTPLRSLLQFLWKSWVFFSLEFLLELQHSGTASSNVKIVRVSISSRWSVHKKIAERKLMEMIN